MAAIRVVTVSRAAAELHDLVSRYQTALRAEGKSEKTIGGYRDIVEAFAAYRRDCGCDANLADLTVDSVRGYILHLQHKPRFSGHPFTPTGEDTLSPETVRCHVRTLKAFSSWLYREGQTAGNRLQNLRLPKAHTRVIVPLTPGEIEAIAAAIDKASPTGERNHAIIVTALDNGQRASELAGIELDHVDFKAGSIRVMGKGNKERIVPIGRYATSLLWGYSTRVRPMPVNPDCNRLFLSPEGQPISANTIKLVFSRLAKRSGVSRLHAHLCRHTFAINYLLNGGDIFSLKEILGHTTLDMVNHYLHFTSSQIVAQHHKYSPMDKLHASRRRARQ